MTGAEDGALARNIAMAVLPPGTAAIPSVTTTACGARCGRRTATARKSSRPASVSITRQGCAGSAFAHAGTVFHAMNATNPATARHRITLSTHLQGPEVVIALSPFAMSSRPIELEPLWL